MAETRIFLTGATGFVGKRVLAGLLKKDPTASFQVLIRSQRDRKAADRLEDLMKELCANTRLTVADLRERLRLVEGDLESPKFGLSGADFDALARSIDRIIHSAASVRLELPLSEARRHNVLGTRSALTLAERALELGGFDRLNHVSTAYVAGKRGGVIYEHELDCDQAFNNSYEQVKMEAERLLELAKPRVPITIFRPSMIMGDSKTGWTNSFNVLYAPIKLAYLGKLHVVPGCNRSRIDTVPIDFVADAIVHLSRLGSEVVGQTYHLTVGTGRAISVEELIVKSRDHLIKYIDQYGLRNPRRVPRMIHPKLFLTLTWLALHLSWGNQRRIYERFQTYTAYTLFYKEFNNDRARALLEPAGITPPALNEYIDVLCKYCVDTHFGLADGPRDVLA